VSKNQQNKNSKHQKKANIPQQYIDT